MQWRLYYSHQHEMFQQRFPVFVSENAMGVYFTHDPFQKRLQTSLLVYRDTTTQNNRVWLTQSPNISRASRRSLEFESVTLGWVVGSTAAHSKKFLALIPDLWGSCMFSSCLYPPGALVFSHSTETCMLSKLETQNCPLVQPCLCMKPDSKRYEYKMNVYT